jgi:hypothetical protein
MSQSLHYNAMYDLLESRPDLLSKIESSPDVTIFTPVSGNSPNTLQLNSTGGPFSPAPDDVLRYHVLTGSVLGRMDFSNGLFPTLHGEEVEILTYAEDEMLDYWGFPETTVDGDAVVGWEIVLENGVLLDLEG